MRNLLGLSFLLLAHVCSAQVEVGSWRSHLPMGTFDFISELNEKVYAANYYGILEYDRQEDTKQSLTKVNTLSRIGITAFQCDSEYGVCIVGYESGDLDIIDENNNVTNQAAIRTSNIVGDKTIRSIYFEDGAAWIATGIGMVQLEIATYNILEYARFSSNGQALDVLDAALLDDDILLSSTNGIYTTSLTKAFQDPEVTRVNFSGTPSKVKQFFRHPSGDVYLLHTNEGDGGDTLFRLDNGAFIAETALAGTEVRWVDVQDQELLISSRVDIKAYNASFELQKTIDRFWEGGGVDVNYAVYADKEGEVLVADGIHGCVISNFDDPVNSKIVNISSPKGGQIAVVNYSDGVVYALPGGNDFTFNIPFLYQLENEEWQSQILFAEDDQSIRNPIDVETFENRKYVGFDGYGYMQLNKNNEILDHVDFPEAPIEDDQDEYYGVRGIEIDEEGNIWMLNNRSLSTLSLLDKDGNWVNFSADDYPKPIVDDLLLLESGLLVFGMKDQGMMIYDPGEDLLSPTDDRWVNINSSPVSGSLNSNTVNCFLEDRDGELWIGTDEGIGIIYSPENAFDEGFSAQQIIVNQDGFNGYLFETDAVIAIEVDGANRKWVAPRGGGLFLISPEGQEQILHFTEEDSPLLDDDIADLAIHPKSGELFIATESGLQSYRSDATDPEESLGALKVFPNPVKPGYNGLITFTGFTPDSYLRITDVAGNLIFETSSQGGTATWDGTGRDGRRVSNGVYLAFAATREGTGGAIVKLLFLNG